ncbi:MAG: hypothetical protein AB7E51_12200 [Pseudodesulfovibrio sp.]|uniref:hypothetical protein n=1 Tax=Pseudodesulfovibrio sp. TaxID=2035812 RepID=UPI003D0BEA1C
MQMWKKILVMFCLLAVMLPAFGCSEEGPMEKAGKKADQAMVVGGDAPMDAGYPAKKIFDLQPRWRFLGWGGTAPAAPLFAYCRRDF